MIYANELVRGVIYERDEYTKEEIQSFQNDLLKHIAELVDYCDTDERSPTPRDKLELLAFTILSTLDGKSGNMGSFLVIPIPESHFYDPNFTLPDNLSNYNIGGELHSNIHKFFK